MARLVHLAPERLQRRIQRSGLRGEEWTISVGAERLRVDEAIFAMPSYRDEQVTYQWLRELRSWRNGERLVAVTFEIDASSEVLFGRFGKQKERGHHQDAYAAIEADPWGAEVVAFGPISPNRIISVRSIRQDIGWQGTPEPTSHDDCACPACLPSGHPKLMRRIRAQFNGAIERIHGAGMEPESILEALSHMDTALERGRGRLSPKRLLSLSSHADARVRKEVASMLRYFKWNDVVEPVSRLIEDADPAVRLKAIGTALFGSGPGTALSMAGDDPELLIALCADLEWSADSSADAALERLSAHGHAGVRAAASQAADGRVK